MFTQSILGFWEGFYINFGDLRLASPGGIGTFLLKLLDDVTRIRTWLPNHNKPVFASSSSKEPSDVFLWGIIQLMLNISIKIHSGLSFALLHPAKGSVILI